jgi:hypothetical protein
VSPLEMARGRTSCLFHFMPEQTYNWQREEGSFKGTDDVTTADLDIPRGWIKHKLRDLIEPFERALSATGTRFTGMSIVEGERFDLWEPRKLTGEFFPRTYVCPECDRFLERSDGGKTVRCPCGGRAAQFSFVEFHRCGHLSGLKPPYCDTGHREGMKLVGRESRSTSEWRWRCAQCNREASRGVYRGCPKCRTGQVGVMRADASAVFRPQYVVTVNPPTTGDYSVFASDRAYRAAVAQALGALPQNGLEGIRQAVNDSGSEDAVEEVKKTLAKMGVKEGTPQFDNMISTYLSNTPSLGDWSKTVNELGLTREQLDALGRDCAELTLARQAYPLTIDDLIAQDSSGASRPLYEEHREALERHNFAEAVLLREFPLAYVVAGYTRQDSEPGPGVNFGFFNGENGKVAMYGQRVETEAILFRLDPGKVLRWLVDSGVVPDPGAVNPQAWIFSRTEGVNRFDTPDDPITAAVLGLVHSVAHRTLAAIASRSGLAPESLSEYLFHRNLTFLIYADTRGEGVLGGLEHVFKHYLGKSLGEMDVERRCVFDPPCNDDKGSCAICMYLSENSCQRFNADLSRHYLFGGEHGGVTWKPFWNA